MGKQGKNTTHTYYTLWRQFKNRLVFNSHKCSIRQPQITFDGAIFTAQGMKPDPVKIQAIQGLPTPENQKQLK